MITSTGRSASSPEHRPRVLLIGHFGIGNLGNDASLRAAAQMIERLAPQADVLVACRRPHVVSEAIGLRATAARITRTAASRQGLAGKALALRGHLHDLAYTARLGYAADVVIVPGTGILDDFGGVPFYDWPLLLCTSLAACRAHGGRGLLLSIGAGPARRKSFARVAALTARLATYASWRDRGSFEFIREHGGGRSGAIVPDLAFTLPRSPSTLDVRPTARPVSIGVMDYRGWWAGRDSPSIRHSGLSLLAETACWLIEEGHDIRLVAADASDVDATRDVAAAIAHLRPESPASVEVCEVADFTSLVEVLADSSAVIATRYHTVLAALLAGRPTISVGYATKNEHLMDLVGLSDYCQLIDEASSHTLRDQFCALMTNSDDLPTTIAQAVDRIRSQLQQQEEDVARQLGYGRGNKA